MEKLEEKLQRLGYNNNPNITHIDNSDTATYIRINDNINITRAFKSSNVYSTTLDLDTVDNLTIVYKNQEYVVDPETLINLLFNYEEIIREIIREELNL